jgi:hypothetical protein
MTPKKYVTIPITRETRIKLKKVCAEMEKSYDETIQTLIKTVITLQSDKFIDTVNQTTPKTVDDTWHYVDRYECYYCKEIFLLYRYNDLDKFHTHIDEFNLIRQNHNSKTKCPKLVRCPICTQTDDQCTEICERCNKEHYFCSCEQIVLLTRIDPQGNLLEVPISE